MDKGEGLSLETGTTSRSLSSSCAATERDTLERVRRTFLADDDDEDDDMQYFCLVGERVGDDGVVSG